MADNENTQSLPPATAIRGYLTLIPFAKIDNGVAVANGVGTTVQDSIRAARSHLDTLVARNGGYTAPPEGKDLIVVANVCPLLDGYDQWHWDGNKAVLRKIAEDGTTSEEIPLNVTLAVAFDPRSDLDGTIMAKGMGSRAA